MWRSIVAFTYLKVKSAKRLCLLQVVLVLSFWSWSWSCYVGLGLGHGLKNLVLFTSLQNNGCDFDAQQCARSQDGRFRLLFWKAGFSR